MIGLKVLLLAATGFWGGEEPGDLVRKLGAPRFSEREAAAQALKELGRDALPSLRSARDAQDPEVRARAAGLVDQIETALMVQPTLVRLDFHDAPIADVVKNLGEQAHVALTLVPENGPAWANRRVTLEESAPVPFWKAIDGLCQAAQLQVMPGVQMLGMGQPGRLPVVSLMASPYPPGPSFVHGPFRVGLTKIVQHRERNFATGFQGGMGGVMAFNGNIVRPGQIPQPPNAPREVRGNVPGVSSELFNLELLLTAEPRMTIAQELDRTWKLTEAVDEKGQSLLPPSGPNAIQHYAGYNGFNPTGQPAIQLTVPLSLPPSPGQTIKRLRGTIPVMVLSRKDDPLVIPLDQRGKTFQNSQIRIQIQDVRKEPNGHTSIELTAKLTPDDSFPPQFRQAAGLGAELMAFRNNVGNSQNPIEIVDAQGRAYPQWFPYSPQPGPDGTRMSLKLMPAEGIGEPVEIRFYEMARASSEIPFELDDIPMP